MNNELLQNLDKLHATPMGVDRIRRNLVFGEGIPDVVAWCKNQVQNPLMYLRDQTPYQIPFRESVICAALLEVCSESFLIS